MTLCLSIYRPHHASSTQRSWKIHTGQEDQKSLWMYRYDGHCYRALNSILTTAQYLSFFPLPPPHCDDCLCLACRTSPVYVHQETRAFCELVVSAHTNNKNRGGSPPGSATRGKKEKNYTQTSFAQVERRSSWMNE